MCQNSPILLLEMYCREALLQQRNNLPNTNFITFCAMFMYTRYSVLLVFYSSGVNWLQILAVVSIQTGIREEVKGFGCTPNFVVCEYNDNTGFSISISILSMPRFLYFQSIVFSMCFMYISGGSRCLNVLFRYYPVTKGLCASGWLIALPLGSERNKSSETQDWLWRRLIPTQSRGRQRAHSRYKCLPRKFGKTSLLSHKWCHP